MILIYVIIAANILFSWKGFEDYSFFSRYKFRIDDILVRKEYVRMLSSGFLHVDYMHLLFNMYAFYTFADVLQYFFNPFEFGLLYFGSLIAGNMLSLYVHRNHGDYSAVGASGAVSGVIYASIALMPEGGIGLVFIPGLSIPSWIFGIIYLLYSMFGIKSQRDNIGHEAHLGGAIAGLVLTVLYFFTKVDFNYWIIAAMLVPTVAFLYLIVYHPEWLITGKIDWSNNPLSRYKRQQKNKPNRPKESKQEELNRLLDKVSKHGLESLSQHERDRLDELSN